VTLEPLVLAGLGLVALLAGALDSVAGGGGLLTVPALLTAGLPPTAALGTNKLQSTAGSMTAAVTYAHGGAVRPRTLWPAVLTTLVGSAAAATVLQQLDTERLERLLPVLLLAIAAYVAFQPRLGAVATRARMSARSHALTVAPVIGAYDGFIGPGTGSFFALSFVGLRGMDLTEATASTKVLNATSNVSALVVFALAGSPVLAAGLVMGLGQAVGARLGARAVLRRGAGLVRPLLVVVSVAMSVRLLLVA
jgi:hypothetical protein